MRSNVYKIVALSMAVLMFSALPSFAGGVPCSGANAKPVIDREDIVRKDIARAVDDEAIPHARAEDMQSQIKSDDYTKASCQDRLLTLGDISTELTAARASQTSQLKMAARNQSPPPVLDIGKMNRRIDSLSSQVDFSLMIAMLAIVSAIASLFFSKIYAERRVHQVLKKAGLL